VADSDCSSVESYSYAEYATKPNTILPQAPSPIPATTTHPYIAASQARPLLQETQVAAAAIKEQRALPCESQDVFGLATTLKREALLYMKMRQQFVQLVKMYQTIQLHRQQLQGALSRP